ncbi:hypothetical protein K1719_018206 [Acacia pycnantha]|nr:hypothetical protein K1719_018206 [Acacia pycnantha]
MNGAATIAYLHYMKHLMKQGNRFNYSDGWNWVRETLNTPGESYRMFRMEPNVVLELENILVSKGWLHPSRELTSLEALSMFLWTCAHSETNRNVQNRFGKSGETISRKFSEVLDSLCSLCKGNCEASVFGLKKFHHKLEVIVDIGLIFKDA